MEHSLLALPLLPAIALTPGASTQRPAVAPTVITLGTMGGPVADGQRSQPANALVRDNRAYRSRIGPQFSGPVSIANDLDRF